MPPIVIRGYRSDDEPQLLAVWNAALPLDTIDAPTFRRKVLLDANFDPERLLVAELDGRLAGFGLCLIRQVPLSGLDLEPERGWITAFGVHSDCRRQGIGAALLDRACAIFAEHGRKQVLIAPYTPNYFVPGVDVRAYAEGVRFLQNRGFRIVNEALSMDANIVGLQVEGLAGREARLAERGIQVRAILPHELPDFAAFLAAYMPPDWLRHGRELMVDITRGLASEQQITLAVEGGQIVGFCLYEGEHFGPFGVREDRQGGGIGTVLLARCLMSMRAAGHHNAWVLWTSDHTAEHVYSRFGFSETRRFAILRMDLGG